MARPHYSKQQLLQLCNQVARERRMADRSPWTAMNIIFGYTLLKCKDFKGKRIYSVSQAVDAYENKYEAGEINLKVMSQKLVDDYAEIRWNTFHHKKTENWMLYVWIWNSHGNKTTPF